MKLYSFVTRQTTRSGSDIQHREDVGIADTRARKRYTLFIRLLLNDDTARSTVKIYGFSISRTFHSFSDLSFRRQVQTKKRGWRVAYFVAKLYIPFLFTLRIYNFFFNLRISSNEYV